MNRRKFLSFLCGIPVISVVSIPALAQDIVRPPIGTISLDALRRVTRILRENSAIDTSFLVFVRPYDVRDLQNFVPVEKYARLQPISSQEIGSYGEGCRCLRSPEYEHL
mgnify:CR=1 FL=1